MRSGLIVSMAANAADDGRGAAAAVWIAFAEFCAKAAGIRLKKNTRRVLRMVRSRLLDERRRILRMALLYEKNHCRDRARTPRRIYALSHQGGIGTQRQNTTTDSRLHLWSNWGSKKAALRNTPRRHFKGRAQLCALHTN